MFKKFLFLSLVIFSTVKPAEDDYWKAQQYLDKCQYFQAISLLKDMTHKHDYYDRVFALTTLAKLYSGLRYYRASIDYPVRPNKKKAIAYLDIILNSSLYSLTAQFEAQKLKAKILNS